MKNVCVGNVDACIHFLHKIIFTDLCNRASGEVRHTGALFTVLQETTKFIFFFMKSI